MASSLPNVLVTSIVLPEHDTGKHAYTGLFVTMTSPQVVLLHMMSCRHLQFWGARQEVRCIDEEGTGAAGGSGQG